MRQGLFQFRQGRCVELLGCLASDTRTRVFAGALVIFSLKKLQYCIINKTLREASVWNAMTFWLLLAIYKHACKLCHTRMQLSHLLICCTFGALATANICWGSYTAYNPHRCSDCLAKGRLPSADAVASTSVPKT